MIEKPLARFLMRTYEPKYRMWFFLSPHIVNLIAFLICVGLFYADRGAFDRWGFNVLFIGAFYLFFWVGLMSIRFDNIATSDGLKKREFRPIGETDPRFITEAKRNGWAARQTKILGRNLGFKITGAENGTPFEIEKTIDAGSGGSSSSFTTCIYIKTKANKNFEIKTEDLKKTANSSDAKERLINDTRPLLVWLMAENPYLQKIGFYNGSLGAIIWDETETAPRLKEVLAKLIQIKEQYNQYA